MAADAGFRQALRDVRAARAAVERAWRRQGAAAAVPLEIAYASAGTALRVAARQHLPPGLHLGATPGAGGRHVVALYADYPGGPTDPGWDLHARALERGDVVLLPAPDGSGEVVGI
ncbi:hypothetical protein [Elioraea tepidiphila]|uniref:hypothetical protein n=1 Tax=Elioraea tepidiphila TaxID=457934 RepID=UPI002FD90947